MDPCVHLLSPLPMTQDCWRCCVQPASYRSDGAPTVATILCAFTRAGAVKMVIASFFRWTMRRFCVTTGLSR